MDYGAVSAETMSGGIRINYVPQQGGNSLSGRFFGTFVNNDFQANNFSDELRGQRSPRAQLAQQVLRLQPVDRRRDREGQGVVLRRGAVPGEQLLPGQQLLQPERRRPHQVDSTSPTSAVRRWTGSRSRPATAG